jgi:outer membrane autotransporter protein
MNKAYRTVWSETRGSFIVAHEHARGRGKSSCPGQTVLARCIGVAFLALGAASAMGQTVTVNAPVYGNSPGAEQLSDGQSLVNNSIIGGTDGYPAVLITNSASVGSITNHGTIASSTTLAPCCENNNFIGIFVSQGTVAGGITNSGSQSVISADNIGIEVVGTASVVTNGISNSGTITGGVAGIAVTGAGARLSGGILNGGTIEGTLLAGVYVAGQAQVSGGITNSRTGVISGASGISIGAATVDFINNAGKITGIQSGIDVEDLGASVTAGITNSGTITAPNWAGVLIASQAQVSGGITNSRGGVISGASGISLERGRVDFINNAGTISSLGGGCCDATAGIGLHRSTITGAIVNSGLISGTGAGISLQSGSSIARGISNSVGGTISGAVAGISVNSASTIAGGITNSGKIAGANDGILTSGVGSTIKGVNNAVGAVISGGEVGIALVAQSTISGAIINSGTIAGSQYAIDALSTVSGGVLNSAVIAARNYSIDTPAMASLEAIDIVGANTAKFVGDVLAPNAVVTINSGATFTGTNAFVVQSFAVSPGATFAMGVMSSSVHDNAGITVSQGVTNAGTLSVGRGVAATITGDYTQAATGVFGIGASSKSDYSKLLVSGSATLPSAAKIEVDVANINTLASGQTLTGVISAGSLSASTFDVTDNSSLFSFSGHVHGDDVNLVIAANASVLHDVKVNGNLPAVGAAIVLDRLIGGTGLGSMNTVTTALGKFETSQEVSNAVTGTLPLLTGASPLATAGFLSDMNRVVQARIDANHGLSSGDIVLEDQNVWLKPFGSWADQSNSNGAAGFKANVGGLGMGVDAAISNTTRLGMAFVVATADVSSTSSIAPAGDQIALYELAGYGSTSLDAQTELNYQLDVGNNWNSGQRQIDLTGATAKASYDSYTAHAAIGIGRSIPLGESTVLTPSVRADYTWVGDQSYFESGAGPLDLRVPRQTFEQFLTSANAKLSQKMADDMSLFASLGASYDSLARQTSITAAYAGAPGLSFATNGVAEKPWMVLAGLGLLYVPKNGPEITARYDVEKRDGFTNQSVSVKVRWSY